MTEQNAYDLVKIGWEHCTIGFYCVCGEGGYLCADSEMEPQKCPECGRVYTISVKFTVDRDLAEDARLMADVIENNLVDVNVPAKNLMLRLRAYADEIERLRAAINTEILKELLDRYESIRLGKLDDEEQVENDDGKIMRYIAIGRTKTGGFHCGYGEDLQGAIDELSETIDELRALLKAKRESDYVDYRPPRQTDTGGN